jgi:small subunit ribosomal protein S3
MVMSSIRTKFIDDSVKKSMIAEFLEKELENVLVANVTIQKSPIETRIYIEMLDPKRMISKRNKKLQELVNKIKKEFGIENPNISIVEVKEPWLEPRIIAKRAARAIEKGEKIKAVLNKLMRLVMSANAMGVEIVASGKLGAKGSKARSIKVSAGFVPKAGHVAKYVGYYKYGALTKSGIIGISVRIARKELMKLIKPELYKEESKDEAVIEGQNETENAKEYEEETRTYKTAAEFSNEQKNEKNIKK